MKSAEQVVTRWSAADRQRGTDKLQYEIHHVTSATHKHFAKLFQHHKWWLLQVVHTKSTGPRSVFAKKDTEIRSAVEDEVWGVVNMTSRKHVDFQDIICDAETKATTWWMADTDGFVNKL